MLGELVPDSQFEYAQINPVLQPLQDFQPMASEQFIPPKLHPIAPQKTSVNFLLSVAKLGSSMEKNVSERDEEILASEVDPIRGWSLHLDEQV